MAFLRHLQSTLLGKNENKISRQKKEEIQGASFLEWDIIVFRFMIS